MDYKICIGCGNELPATTEFFHKLKRGGLRARCKVCRNKREQEYYRNNKEKYIAAARKWQKNNKERHASSTKKWCKENPEKVAVHDAKWRKANPEKIAALNVKRRTRKLNQTPNLTQDEKRQIELIYKKSRELGLTFQVDHIKPLSKGGLHRPDNLQIVLKSYNLQKSDKIDFRPPTIEELYILDEGVTQSEYKQ